MGKIRSHEIFLLGEIDPSQAKKDLALKAKSEHKSKKKNKGKAPSPMMRLVKNQVMWL